MTQLGFSGWFSKLHWRALILILALLALANFVFFDDTLGRAFSARQGQQSLTDSKTSTEVEDWEVVSDPLRQLGKAGIQELGLGLEATRTSLVKSTALAAPTNPSRHRSRI
ncbi:hypothetical protein ACLOAV_005237 [Pseudogymnoascus australis]